MPKTPPETPPKTVVTCPHCKQQTEYSPENAFRPFCSERCRLIDLGNWADGTYAIPVAPARAEDLEPGGAQSEPHDEEDEIDDDLRH